MTTQVTNAITIEPNQVLLLHVADKHVCSFAVCSMDDFMRKHGFAADLTKEQRTVDTDLPYVATVNDLTAEVMFGPLQLERGISEPLV